MEDKGDWVAMALEDDAVAAEMLIQFSSPPSPPRRLRWGCVRKRCLPSSQRVQGWCLGRDEEAPALVAGEDAGEYTEEDDWSPTTPLEWGVSSSSGSDPSGGSGGFGMDSPGSGQREGVEPAGDDALSTSDRGNSDASGSRIVAAAQEANALRSPSNRPKIASLKFEENMLLIQRINLENNMKKLRATHMDLVEQNELLNLKMITLLSQNTSNAKPGTVASDISGQAMLKGILPSEAAESFPMTAQSVSNGQPGILACGAVEQVDRDPTLLASVAKLFSRPLPSDVQQNVAAAETSSASSLQASYIPDLNLPSEIGFWDDMS